MTTIKTTDFSTRTLEMFNVAKESNTLVDAFDFARILIDNDYPIEDVKQFMKSNFKNNYKYLDYSI